MLSQIQRINSRIDQYLAPKKVSRNQTYKNIITDLDFDRALHFGSGRDKRGFGRSLEDKGDVIAIDPDSSGLKKNDLPRKILADGQRLPFADDSFDLVFSEYVFEHLPDPHSALSEIERVLIPGGSFIVLVPNPNHYYARIADLAPFWFHQLWFKLQGVENHQEDRFPTQYKWGTYADIIDSEWSLEYFESFPGPTSYTKILPIHFIFVLFDRKMANKPRYHVCYLAHYRL